MKECWPRAVLFVALTGLACGGDDTTSPQSQVPPTTGRAVIDCRLRYDAEGHLYGSGFSFASGAVTHFPVSDEAVPDVIVMTHVVESAGIVGVLMGSLTPPARFHLVARSSTASATRAVFDTLNCVSSEATFDDIALPTEENDVWVVRTSDRHFAKLFIVDTFAASQTVDSASMHHTTEYSEITFDWVYQPKTSSCLEGGANQALGRTKVVKR